MSVESWLGVRSPGALGSLTAEGISTGEVVQFVQASPDRRLVAGVIALLAVLFAWRTTVDGASGSHTHDAGDGGGGDIESVRSQIERETIASGSRLRARQSNGAGAGQHGWRPSRATAVGRDPADSVGPRDRMGLRKLNERFDVREPISALRVTVPCMETDPSGRLGRRRLLAMLAAGASATSLAGCASVRDRSGVGDSGATDVIVHSIAAEPRTVSVTITAADAASPHTARTLAVAPGEVVDPVNAGKLPTNTDGYTVEVAVTDGPSETFEWTESTVQLAPLWVRIHGTQTSYSLSKQDKAP